MTGHSGGLVKTGRKGKKALFKGQDDWLELGVLTDCCLVLTDMIDRKIWSVRQMKGWMNWACWLVAFFDETSLMINMVGLNTAEHGM